MADADHGLTNEGQRLLCVREEAAPRWHGEGQELAGIRLAAGASQRAVAAILGVAQVTVSSWERGRCHPPADAAERWREVCAQAARQHPRRDRRPTIEPAELRRIRAETGATQQGVAAVIGVPPDTVSRWERGQCRPGPDVTDRVWRDACTQAAAQHPPKPSGPSRRAQVIDPAQLLQMRLAAGASIGWLATVLGTASSAVRSWETGRVAAPAEVAERWPQACAEAAHLARRGRQRVHPDAEKPGPCACGPPEEVTGGCTPAGTCP
jgi:DNA-binding transcriptional regulator YiaG